MPIEGEPMYDYDGNLTHTASCTMDRCLARAKEMIGWDEKYPCRDMGNGKVRGVGLAMAMQGSSIANVDVGGATLKLNEDASYTLSLGCADMGTGCDTILSQMAADCLETEFENIVAFGVVRMFLHMTPVLMHLPLLTLQAMQLLTPAMS